MAERQVADGARRRRIEGGTFVLAANGSPGTPPADGVREFLMQEGASSVTVLYHPLSTEDGPQHRIVSYEPDRAPTTRTIRLPSRPPFTYALDPLVPLCPPRCDCWIGFNNLAALRGLAQRALGLAGTVVYWAVDFVPNRFGPGLLTRAYDRLDRLACTRSDLRVEVTEAARDARTSRLRLPASAAPATVAPIGVWLDRVPVTDENAWRTRRIVFTGHLVPRQGVSELVRAISLVATDGVTLEVSGRGPLRSELEAQVRRLGLGERVRFHGFLDDHRDVDALLASAAIGVAPYDTGMESFTQFADPAKLRGYTAAGLPVLVTSVPPNADELARRAGAEIVAFRAEEIAAAIDRLLSAPVEWQRRRAAALAYSRDFDWSRIVSSALAPIGFQGRD
jgi:glycosyltransferase involved in cell wall biosynthesis